jgi:quinohemoprotein ethanol dehydrogenase
MILADLEIGGRTRMVLMQAPKNGFFYVLDRSTGELLSAEKYAPVSWARRVDLTTGRPVEREEALWSTKPAAVSPGVSGAHNWHPMSYSPRTGLVYIPTNEFVYPFYADPSFEYTPGGTFNTGEDWAALAENLEGYEDAFRFCTPTHLTAWDPTAGVQRWRVEHESQVPGGVLSTAGDLVFQGRGSGQLAAYDAATGEKLWEVETGIGVMAPPISYRIGDEQYIAVLAGVGGSHGVHRDSLRYVNDGRILAWKLGGTATMPPLEPITEKPIQVPKMELAPERVSRGRGLYARHCARCHGIVTRGAGVIPDLRRSSAAVHESWNTIVLGGALAGGGMASFADVLNEKDAEAIHAYVVARALHEPHLLQRAALWLSQHVCIPASWAAD